MTHDHQTFSPLPPVAGSRRAVVEMQIVIPSIIVLKKMAVMFLGDWSWGDLGWEVGTVWSPMFTMRLRHFCCLPSWRTPFHLRNTPCNQKSGRNKSRGLHWFAVPRWWYYLSWRPCLYIQVETVYNRHQKFEKSESIPESLRFFFFAAKSFVFSSGWLPS